MKPLIGITLHEKEDYYTLNFAYAKCIALAGGIPLLIPHGTVMAAAEMSNFLSALVLSGGGDIDPVYFAEEPTPDLGTIYPERDFWEIELCQQFLKKNKPILGICRGLQVLNVAAGGTLWQTIPHKEIKHFQDAPASYPTHTIEISAASKLFKAAGTEKIRVNSMHHQAICAIAPGFKATAYATDGIVEAIESQENTFVMGVQWHPEHLWELSETKKIFSFFVGAAKEITGACS